MNPSNTAQKVLATTVKAWSLTRPVAMATPVAPQAPACRRLVTQLS